MGFDDDMRDYSVAAEMLRLLGLRSVALMTNNPRKVRGLQANGIVVSHREPILIDPNPHNANYLRVKKQKSGHLLDHL